MVVIKKDGTEQDFDINKVVVAVGKSAGRCMHRLTDDEVSFIEQSVSSMAKEYADDNDGKIPIAQMHIFAELALDKIDPEISKSYRDYRNYKTDFCAMLDSVYQKSQSIRYIGDVSNANTDSSMISTQRSLIYGKLNKELYRKFFLNKEELQAANDGYIYIHDMKDRLDGLNCCLADIHGIVTGGFEMGNVWYNEPKTLDVLFDVVSDVTLSTASQQYGGFTIPRVDSLVVPYAEKSYNKYLDEYKNIVEDCGGIYNEESADIYATKKVRRDMEQGFQSWEMRFNTVGSSRGDYPFIACSFGLDTSKFGIIAIESILKVRMEGQGKEGFKKPVLFPKLSFFYNEELHGEGKEFEYLFDLALECSRKTMYPDYISLTGEGYIPSMYKKYKTPISLMGKTIAHVKLREPSCKRVCA
jgi:ribonucleoside-triphosphate reductase